MLNVEVLKSLSNAKLFMMKEERVNKYEVLKKQLTEITDQMNDLSLEYNLINGEMQRRNNVRTSNKDR